MSLLSPTVKQELKHKADLHLQSLFQKAEELINIAQRGIGINQELAKQIVEYGLNSVDEAATMNDIAQAKIDVYGTKIQDLEKLKDSPYFVRLEVEWQDTNATEVLYIGKYSLMEQKIFSWVAPISTLRYSPVGPAYYEKPNGEQRQAKINRKDTFLITGGQIVLMTYEDLTTERQTIFQKHLDERKDFMLPEIVAELDKLQDQIIRSEPNGTLLITGPAGSGKTTLALHRVAYLCLNPEFKDYFEPERILVFVSNSSDVTYFRQLLPELGINGVKVTTYGDWAASIVNSRFPSTSTTRRFKYSPPSKIIEFVSKQKVILDLNPRQLIDIYRKIKQELIFKIPIPLKYSAVYPTLKTHYSQNIDHLPLQLQMHFKDYLKFLETNLYLDEADLTLIVTSLDQPPRLFKHVVVDEVQNWLLEQLRLISKLATNNYKSISLIGDINQKTKSFAVKSWDQLQDFGDIKHTNLVSVYRNTQQILKYIESQGYKLSTTTSKQGELVKEANLQKDLSVQVSTLVNDYLQKHPGDIIGIIGRYESSIQDLQSYNYSEVSNVKVLTAEAAQGLEFDYVIIVNKQEFLSFTNNQISKLETAEFNEQNYHLFYVACTRAKSKLDVLIN